MRKRIKVINHFSIKGVRYELHDRESLNTGYHIVKFPPNGLIELLYNDVNLISASRYFSKLYKNLARCY